MFHALLSAGLASPLGCDIPPDISQMRANVLNIASEAQLNVAASGDKDGGVPVEEYKRGLLAGEWGDNLVIALLAKHYQQSISVISLTYARTWSPDGQEQCGVEADALWIAHAPERHYYGIFRAAAKDESDQFRRQRLGLIRACCPLCSAAAPCALHSEIQPSPKRRRLRGETPWKSDAPLGPTASSTDPYVDLTGFAAEYAGKRICPKCGGAAIGMIRRSALCAGRLGHPPGSGLDGYRKKASPAERWLCATLLSALERTGTAWFS